VLVNKCRIYEEDSKARSNHYKATSEKNGRDKNRGKPYNVLAYKRKKKKGASEKEASGGYNCAPLRCFNCEVVGHCASECQSIE